MKQTRRDRWDGNVNHKDPFLFHGFFQQSLFSLLKFSIFIHLVYVLFIYAVVDCGFVLLIMKTVVNSVILHSA